MNWKALARYFYANIPGVAVARFALKDALASRFGKPEYRGIRWLSIGNGVIVDVGANRGQSIAAFRRLARKSSIVAFEPEPMSAKRLISRYRADNSVTIHACALGTQKGTVKFFIPSYGRWNCEGMAAVDRKMATDWLNDPGRMYRFDKTKLTVTEHNVESNTLDCYDLTPRLIKLHAQGAELDILKGSIETIRQHRPALMCAFPTKAVTEFLAGLGYRPYVYGCECFTSGITQPPKTFTWYLTEDHAHHVPIGKP